MFEWVSTLLISAVDGISDVVYVDSEDAQPSCNAGAVSNKCATQFPRKLDHGWLSPRVKIEGTR